jgi:hypothetical protein
MMNYNDLSQYSQENILHTAARPAHSGPEVMPQSKHADRLALEVVLDKISLDIYERPSTIVTSATRNYFKINL